MFPLSIGAYVRIGACALLLAGAWYFGYSFEHSRFVAFKATIVAQTAAVEKQNQAATDLIRKEKDAQIRNINTQLVDAISELRKRPSRTNEASNGQSGTGTGIFAEDAIFLRREAARADEIRAGLDACYKQYDSIK